MTAIVPGDLVIKCKVGDLAIMTMTINEHTKLNRGRICEVLEPIGMQDTPIGSLFYWRVKFAGLPGKNSQGSIVQSGGYPDAYLTPINPPALESDTQAEREMQG